MADIEVHRTGADVKTLSFDVVVREGASSSNHVVTLSRADIDAAPSPEDLVRRAFEFLLEREPKESILARFDLRDISTYFPEFDIRVLGSGS